jgi:hypothetical protein
MMPVKRISKRELQRAVNPDFVLSDARLDTVLRSETRRMVRTPVESAPPARPDIDR